MIPYFFCTAGHCFQNPTWCDYGYIISAERSYKRKFKQKENDYVAKKDNIKKSYKCFNISYFKEVLKYIRFRLKVAITVTSLLRAMQTPYHIYNHAILEQVDYYFRS